MKPVGGYFELEINEGPYSYHSTPYTFKSGRSALHVLLQVCKPGLVYVPFYTCNALLHPFEVAGVPYKQYAISETLEPVSLPELAAGEYFLYINYFGLKDETVNVLSKKYGNRLIVDCTQAFFSKGNGQSWYYNSCRKFFGVPDGAYLYVPDGITMPAPAGSNEDYTVEHLLKRLNGHTQEGYAAFQLNETLCGTEIKSMSILSQRLLSNVNYTEVIAQRRANFMCLQQLFKKENQLTILFDADSVPMVYPLLPGYNVDRGRLYQNKFFIPTFWADVREGNHVGFEIELQLTSQLLPLPVDHRYTEADMKRMAATIQTANE